MLLFNGLCIGIFVDQHVAVDVYTSRCTCIFLAISVTLTTRTLSYKCLPICNSNSKV